MENESGNSLPKMEEYEILEQIGRGAFGSVFLVLHKTQKKRYVLKKIRLSKHSEKLKPIIYQEMELIAKLDHPYIVGFKDAWVEKSTCICIVTHYCEGGDMSAIVRNARGQYFSEEKLCKWLTQLLLALDYLHSNRVLHRDLKLSNIFVTKENDIRLGDFGLAKLLNEQALASSVVGTPTYMCPEVLADIPYGYKSDIWSLGCCMFEIAAHQQAFRAPDMAGLINKINRSLISPMPIVYSSSIKQIIKSMLRKSPDHRPTAAELLRHPHLQPFLLRCHNPSTVFLPVKSPSPTNSKEKNRKPSPATSLKDHRERDVKLKQKELLPLFDESTSVQYMNLLDDFVQIEEKLETKRVDPTSYSGKISHDSEDSKSGDTACNDHPPQDHFDSLSITKERICTTDSFTLTSNAVSEAQAKENGPESMPLNEGTEISEANAQPRNFSNAAETSVPNDSLAGDMPKVIKKEVQDELLKKIAAISEQSKDWENPGRQRADALESLLELCARLMKQDKFDELSGVLKPFGDDAVSSRETAIWLTKSLMNAQKFPKQL